MKKLIILIILLFAWPCFGATYNIGPGQTYTTFTALSAAHNLTGDDIVDGGGNTFRETWIVNGSGSDGHPIILRNATIYGSVALTTWADQGSNVWRSESVSPYPYHVWFDRTIWGDRQTAQVNVVDKYDWYTNGVYVYVYATETPTTYYPDGVESANVLSGIFIENKSYVTIENVTVMYVAQSNTTAEYNLNAGICAINSHHVTVQDCILSKCHTAIAGFQASNYLTVDNNTISNINTDFIAPARAITFEDEHTTISNNNIDMEYTDTGGATKGGNGIEAFIRDNNADYPNFFPNDSVISNNTIRNTGPFAIYVSQRYCQNSKAANIDIYDNDVRYSLSSAGAADRDGIGIGSLCGAGDEITHIHVYRNYVEGYYNCGIHYANNMGASSECYSNIINDCGKDTTVAQGGIKVQKHGTLVYNNTIYNIANGRAIRIGNGLITVPVAAIVSNNIIDTVVAGGSTADDGITCDTVGNATGANNNIYNVAGNDTVNFTNTDGLTVDSKFIDAANGDFHLLVSSPCIDAGADLTATVLTDIDGQDADHANMDGDADGSVTDMDIGADQVMFLAVMTAAGTLKYNLLDGEDDNYAGLAVSGGQDINNNTIARCVSGALRINGTQTIVNTAIDDECYIVSGVTATMVNSAFQQSLANAEGDGTLMDTGCQFSVSDFGFRDKANGNFRLTGGSVLKDAGYNTGAFTDLDGRPTPMGSAHDTGSSEYRRSGGSMSMGLGLSGFCPHRWDE